MFLYSVTPALHEEITVESATTLLPFPVAPYKQTPNAIALPHKPSPIISTPTTEANFPHTSPQTSSRSSTLPLNPTSPTITNSDNTYPHNDNHTENTILVPPQTHRIIGCMPDQNSILLNPDTSSTCLFLYLMRCQLVCHKLYVIQDGKWQWWMNTTPCSSTLLGTSFHFSLP